ncbi:MAG: hypothetical protein GY948_08670 [Alphaproteobacteria bacterium]|nr:hypothetical protein [Alphaproteobacteria bacterium]
MVPLSLEVFLGTLEDFNRMIRPMQMLAAAFGLVALWVVLRPQQLSSRLLGLILASSWAATGLFYHLSTFAELNFWDYPIGLAFLAQAVILFWSGAVANRFTVGTSVGAAHHLGLVLGFYGLAGAPLVGIASGRNWAEVGYFAISPGPTILFTVGVLLMLNGRSLIGLWVLPVLAAVPVSIFGSSLILLEDASVLPIVAVALIIRFRSSAKSRIRLNSDD